MSPSSKATLRQSQVITTYGPGALIDLPNHAAIVGGLDFWPPISQLREIDEPRLVQALRGFTESPPPRLYAPPPEPDEPWASAKGIRVWRFPEWFVVQEKAGGSAKKPRRDRRLVHRSALERNRFDGCPVVPTRFVRTCPRGHVDDLDWLTFVHGKERCQYRQLSLVEVGTTGDLYDLIVRCECGRSRRLQEASSLEDNPLGPCSGSRPWLGRDAQETCGLPSHLLIRTATNAYFPQVVSVLSLPDPGSAIEEAVNELWNDLQIVDDVSVLNIIKRKPEVAERLQEFSEEAVLDAIDRRNQGALIDRTLKQVELEAILGAPEGFGEDGLLDSDFHARRLPDDAWRRGQADSQGIAAVIQLHRLREVMALIGFTRLEAVMRDIHGEYDTDVERAELAQEANWFPAIENRGEGIFVQLATSAVDKWTSRPEVQRRLGALEAGHNAWLEERKSQRDFPGGPYILLHTLAHLLIQSLAMRCGYPATSIRERIYCEGEEGNRSYGILLYTGTPDAEGTLGGLVGQARHIEAHLAEALRMAALCSNDPVCAEHPPPSKVEQRLLHGAACHGCALIAEPSCEMRNDYLDRALVAPTLDLADAGFFALPDSAP